MTTFAQTPYAAGSGYSQETDKRRIQHQQSSQQWPPHQQQPLPAQHHQSGYNQAYWPSEYAQQAPPQQAPNPYYQAGTTHRFSPTNPANTMANRPPYEPRGRHSSHKSARSHKSTRSNASHQSHHSNQSNASYKSSRSHRSLETEEKDRRRRIDGLDSRPTMGDSVIFVWNQLKNMISSKH